MKLIHYLYIAPLAFLAACSNDHLPATDHPDGQIQLSAGIVEGGQQAVTRAGAEDSHAKHLGLTNGTKLALQVSGTWTGHSPVDVVKTTTATVGAPFDVKVNDVTKQHNNVSCSPVLYWDDYGSAAEGNYDPANPTATKNDAETIVYGRGIGLTIYGVAINGKTTAPTVGDYTALSWTLAADQTATNNTPADKDLLISNNVQAAPGATTSNDGTYKFDDRASGKLLEFRHALSKITVNLKAGDGFTGSTFAGTPTVTLVNKEGATVATDSWAYTTGYVNVTTGVVSSQANPAVITMNAATTDATLAAAGYTVTKEALVIPGSAFASDAATIARIDADGNIYYVTAAKIREAIDTYKSNASDAHATAGAYETEAGVNYILKVIVNKTDIVVTATVTNWTDVESEVVDPVINVSASFGETGSTMGDGSFSFYRSLALDNGYSANKTLIDSKYYPEESAVSKSGDDWTMSPTLYWPNHNTHYQFRGVWPRTESVGGPRVEDGSGTTSGYQVIKVQNVAYDDETFPSELQIARPEFADKTQTCTNNEPGHTTTNLWTGGICATEGEINLNFKYMMSQVEVNLSTTNNSLGDAVTLSGAVVEIVNVYSTGDVKLGDREVMPTGSTGSYTLNTTFQGHDNGNNVINITSHPNRRWSAIVPQTLTYSTPQAAENVKFRITITNDDGSIDVYYADVNPILESGKSTKVAPNGKWESGYHYVYNLMLSKTEVKVTATLANWTTVTASENVWF